MKYKEAYSQETNDYEWNINNFYVHGANTMFAETVKGDREKLYSHCAKHHVPRLAKETLDQLGYGAGAWTIQWFDHRRKKSNMPMK